MQDLQILVNEIKKLKMPHPGSPQQQLLRYTSTVILNIMFVTQLGLSIWAAFVITLHPYVTALLFVCFIPNLVILQYVRLLPVISLQIFYQVVRVMVCPLYVQRKLGGQDWWLITTSIFSAVQVLALSWIFKVYEDSLESQLHE